MAAEHYQRVSEEASATHPLEQRDCTVIATAVTTGVHYDICHRAWATIASRRPGNGAAWYGWAESVFESLGFLLEQVVSDQEYRKYQHQWNCENATRRWADDTPPRVSRRQAHKLRYPKVATPITAERHLPAGRRFVVGVVGHVLAVRDGEVQDWTRGRRHMVDGLWEVHDLRTNQERARHQDIRQLIESQPQYAWNEWRSGDQWRLLDPENSTAIRLVAKDGTRYPDNI